MNEAFKTLSDSLAGLATMVDNGGADGRSAFEVCGYAWNVPATDRIGLAGVVMSLKQLIDERAPDEDSHFDAYAIRLAQQFDQVKAQTAMHLFNPNSSTAVPVFLAGIQSARFWVESSFPERVRVNKDELPFQLARRAKSLTAMMNNATSDFDSIHQKLNKIQEAHEVAENLPADMDLLRDAQKEVMTIRQKATSDAKEVDSNHSVSIYSVEAIKKLEAQAAALVAKCEAAYSITTTKGLAAAFDERSRKISSSMWVWVVGLLIALTLGCWLGSHRVEALTELLKQSDPKWASVAIHLFVSFISVGAPFWFAWVATKQIGQRFRLAEDYGFKASVAKAYEGYRKEASKLDPDAGFGIRLFDIALQRLEEPPIRLVENTSHGSPWQEALSSTEFQTAFKTVPGLFDKVSVLVKDAIQKNYEKSAEYLKSQEAKKD